MGVARKLVVTVDVEGDQWGVTLLAMHGAESSLAPTMQNGQECQHSGVPSPYPVVSDSRALSSCGKSWVGVVARSGCIVIHGIPRLMRSA